MRDPLEYEVAVIGGGPAGLTTALYTTRLGHRTAVFEKEGGRHAKATHVHNLLGVSESVSGEQLAAHAVAQFEHYGGDFHPDAVDSVARSAEGGSTAGSETGAEADGEPRFRIESSHATIEADRIVFATGFRDRSPDVPELERFTGRGLHYCLHCDAYALGDGPVFVLGHDEHAARVAMTMCNFTGDVDLLLDGRDPGWDDETDALIDAHPIRRLDGEVVAAYEDEMIAEDEPPWLGGLSFADGTEQDYLGGFAMYGSSYNADLAADLGCDLDEDGAIDVDERRETSIEGAYAVGDVTHGQNQTTIAIGDGAYAGIAIHKDLRRFPLSTDDIEGGTESEESSTEADRDIEAPAAAADLRAQMRRVREIDTHPGLRGPSPGRD
ncbi:NAD(P)/FAD-dependent oxidoreductase [Halosolutus gelatinilyticus]|uniref:NAD(P)/FAD-dependent oxidoreductase n=1 Tax=Halosolutus gelatinilyticus TaxID=2931975 RepID=UPI001FF64704|nr:NAD(P)/FAD-dependent oxidoreductase [Halosolutus gelatinilyticus]